MKKRHEMIALLAAAAGLTIGGAAQASTNHVESALHPALERHALQLGHSGSVTDDALSRMIYLADAQGFSRSGNVNAAGSPDKSPQGNGHAKGYDSSGNPNAAGSPTKPAQGSGNP